jgi:hypothetical protein
MLGKLFRYRRQEGTGGWGKCYNEDLHKLYFIITIIKSRSVKSAGVCSTRGRDKSACKVLVGKPEELLKDLDIDGMLILKWVLKKWGGKVWTRFFWLKTEACKG